MTEKEKFFAWLEGERKKGLLDIHFTANPDRDKNVTEEEIYAELNQMIEAPAVPDLRLFPNGNVFSAKPSI